MSVNLAPSPCNICGSTKFAAAPNRRVAPSGLPSHCQGCGSLEHQRVLRAVLEALPRPMLEGASCLRLSADPALDRGSLFAQLSTLAHGGVPSTTAELASGSFGWLCATRGLTGSDADRSRLEELLRLVGRGCVALLDNAAAEYYSTGFNADEWLPRVKGARYTDALRALVPQAAVLELVGLDASSLSLDSVFIVSLDAERLRQMAAVATARNLHARVFEPRSSSAPDQQHDEPPARGEPSGRAAGSFSPLAVMCASLPLEFEERAYRELHGDVAKLSPSALREHYRRHGQREGRRGHSLPDRVAFAALVAPELDALELRPGSQPRLNGRRVRYFEQEDKATMLARDSAASPAPQTIPDFDYVSATGDLSVINETFDVVFADRVINRTPDFVGHLQAVRRLLRPGGLYLAVLPDKTYGSARFMPPTTIADLLDAHEARRVRHTLRSRIAATALMTHDDARRHWRGEHGELARVSGHLASTIDEYVKASDRPVDVDAWYFDPSSFAQCLQLLKQLDETDFSLVRLYPTQLDQNEFWVILQAGGVVS